jgi:hypothetical protein
MALVFCDVCPAQESEPVGYVSDLTGEWLENDRSIEKKGEPVYDAATIILDPTYKAEHPMQGSISLVFYDGRREEFSAGVESNKLKPIGPQTNGWTRFYEAVVSLFIKRPEKYLTASVRGAQVQELQEAVVKLDDDKVDLAPVLQMARSGTYRVRFIITSARDKGCRRLRS